MILLSSFFLMLLNPTYSASPNFVGSLGFKYTAFRNGFILLIWPSFSPLINSSDPDPWYFKENDSLKIWSTFLLRRQSFPVRDSSMESLVIMLTSEDSCLWVEMFSFLKIFHFSMLVIMSLSNSFSFLL
jgi:hypothetical protein